MIHPTVHQKRSLELREPSYSFEVYHPKLESDQNSIIMNDLARRSVYLVRLSNGLQKFDVS